MPWDSIDKPRDEDATERRKASRRRFNTLEGRRSIDQAPARPVDYSQPHPCHDSDCDGICRYVDDEYGGLAGGGDYEKWRCDKCGRVTWAARPD